MGKQKAFFKKYFSLLTFEKFSYTITVTDIDNNENHGKGEWL